MAISFKNIKSTVLDMTDVIHVGKLQGCRVCDVIPEHYEYLIWADKQGLLKFTRIVTETIKEHFSNKNWETHQEQEVTPWVDPNPWFAGVLDEDVPF